MKKLFEVTIELTQRCPNRCIYCSSLSSLGKAASIDFATVCQIVDDASMMGAQLINLSGGEPLLRGDIAEIAEYIHAKGMKIRLYSSGIYFDGAYHSIPVGLLESLKGNVDNLIFNYETCEPELYGEIMGTVADNLKLLDKSIADALALGIRVEAHIVPMRCNYRQIPETLDKLYRMGVSKVSLLRLVPQGRVHEYEDKILVTEAEQSELDKILEELSARYGKEKLRLGKPYRQGKYSSCMTGTIRLAVRYDGFVFPCGAFKDGVMKYGGFEPDSVFDKRLADIYENSEYIAKVREDLDTYYEGDVSEPCFGQYCRSTKSFGCE